ncbi:hypothetical protein MMC29_005458 [Sticta canariensis]|nr:hypothetical protein [Sticta canariensis]
MDVSACEIGLMCALSLELQALQAIFDEEPTPLRAGSDLNVIYHGGRIGKHYAIAACLPSGSIGSGPAGYLAGRMQDAFPSLKYRFLVGIAGGVPHQSSDIRLGDIVIGTKIVQYDFGKQLPNGKFQRTREPFHAPSFVANFLSGLKADVDVCKQIDQILLLMKDRRPALQNSWTHPGQDQDRLFKADYDHNTEPDNPRCEKCDKGTMVTREPRSDLLPMWYDGPIASANQVMRDGRSRDLLKSDLTDILAVEMEASGLENYNFGVIRGICDYADSHKHDQWQHLASARAAAFTKVLLDHIPTNRCNKLSPPIPRRPEKQLYSINSVKYSITFCDKQEPNKPTVIFNLDSTISLLQEVGDRYFEVSRKLLLQHSGSDHELITLWLPFDRILVCVQGCLVKLKFSDCIAMQSRTVEGRSRYSGRFDPERPNINVSLTFSNDSIAQDVAEQILCVNCTIDNHSVVDIIRSPERSSQDISFTLYDCFETREKTGQVVNMLAIMTSIAKDNYKRSEAFFLGPYLDFELSMSHEEPKNVGFRGLEKIHYLGREDTMPCWPLPWAKENSEGKPEGIDLEKVAAIDISFLDEPSYQNFMSAITGWQLKFTANTKFRSYKRDKVLKVPSHESQVTIWSKISESGSTECHIIIHLYKAHHTVNKWISSVLIPPGMTIGTASSSMEYGKRNETIVLDGVEVFESTHIVRSTMLAGPLKEQNPHQFLYRQEFKFKDPRVSKQFADTLGERIVAMKRTLRP